jgi:hypothetical protein
MKVSTTIAPLRNLTVALIAFCVVSISAFADQNNPCNPGCAKWTCNTGSVTNAPLSSTNQVICLGTSPSVPAINAGVVPGSKTQVCTNSDCTTTTTTNAINYSLSTWWEPAISQDSDCTNDTATVTVGTLTVKVVNVGTLNIIGSPIINLCSNSANTVQVCASNSCGNLTWSIAPTYTNGASISGGGSCATVNLGEIGANYTVTATSSENTNCANSIGLNVSRDCDCSHHQPGPVVAVTAFIPPGGCQSTQTTQVVYYNHTNKCGQIILLDCAQGSIHFRVDGVLVGRCPYAGTHVRAEYKPCVNDEVVMGTRFRVISVVATNYDGTTNLDYSHGVDWKWDCPGASTYWCYTQVPPDVNTTNGAVNRDCDFVPGP